MTKSTFSYEDVAKICQTMTEQGNTPSIQSVRSALGGGSTKRILEYLRQWQKERTLSAAIEDDLSAEFRQAALAECARKLGAVKERLQTKINERETQINELQEILDASEEQVLKLTAELVQVKKDTEAASLNYEKQLAAAREQVTIRTEYADEIKQKTEQQIAALQVQLEQMQEAKHDAAIRAATAEARYAELEKRLTSS